MKRRLKLGAVFAAMLFISMAFVPAVMAAPGLEKEIANERALENANEHAFSAPAPRNEIKNIKWIHRGEIRKEYFVTIVEKETGKESTYFVKHWQTDDVRGKKVWNFNVFEVDENGCIADDPAFGFDSWYYWRPGWGTYIHLGPKDARLVMTYGPWLIEAVVTAITGSAKVGAAVSAAVQLYYNRYKNPDGSLDIFIPYWVYEMTLPYAIIRIGGTWVRIW
ncbi:MAG: hypothetical protein QMC78_01775 [Methanocellales archaeon]|nr:hypothetical protein [Methanocellales archaeon]